MSINCVMRLIVYIPGISHVWKTKMANFLVSLCVTFFGQPNLTENRQPNVNTKTNTGEQFETIRIKTSLSNFNCLFIAQSAFFFS